MADEAQHDVASGMPAIGMEAPPAEAGAIVAATSAATSTTPSSMLTTLKDAAAVVQAVLTSAAIVLAGVWFYFQREALPRAHLTHAITHRRLADNVVWMHVTVDVENVGKRALELGRKVKVERRKGQGGHKKKVPAST